MAISREKFMHKYDGKSVAVPWGFEGECVSLVQMYLHECFDIPLIARGNAKDYGNNLLNNGLARKVNDIQYGDIIVWGSNMGGGYGHIAIVVDKYTIFDQNNNYVLPARVAQHRPMFNIKPLHVLRMNKKPTQDKPKTFSFVKGQKLQISGYYPTVHNGSFIAADGMQVLVEGIYKDDKHPYGITDLKGNYLGGTKHAHVYKAYPMKQNKPKPVPRPEVKPKPTTEPLRLGDVIEISGHYPTVHNGTFISTPNKRVIVEGIYKDDKHRYGVNDMDGKYIGGVDYVNIHKIVKRKKR